MGIANWITKNKSAILSALAMIGVPVAMVLTAKAVPDAAARMAQFREEKRADLTALEKVQASAKPFVPAVAAGAATVACIAAAHRISRKEIAAASALGVLSARRLDDWKQQVKEEFGKDGYDRVVEGLAVEKANPPVVGAPTLLETCHLSADDGAPPMLFYDSYSERYFESTLSNVLMAEYFLNRDFCLGGDVSVNHFYEMLGIAGIADENLGWSWDDGIAWIDFDHTTAALEDGMEACVISFAFEPTAMEL